MPETHTVTRDWTIEGAESQPIYGTTHTAADADDARGVLIICHGFKGYKDYGLFPHLAEAAAQRGFIAHRFNFSHSGMTPNIDTFERPDLFERDTWRRQVRDLHAVSGAIRRGVIDGAAKPAVWFGHSRGGITVLLAAADAFAAARPGHEPPRGIVTAAAPEACCNLDEDQQAMLRRAGRLPSPSSRTGQTLYVGRSWLAEIEADPQWHDPLRAIREVACPVLVVHGTEDATVPAESARHLTEASGDHAELHLIEGASHTFDAPNPLPLDNEPPAATRELIELTCAFAARCCGG